MHKILKLKNLETEQTERLATNPDSFFPMYKKLIDKNNQIYCINHNLTDKGKGESYLF